MKRITLLIDPESSCVVDDFAREISKSSEIHTIIGTKENLNNIIKEDKFSDSYTKNRTIALGDKEEFKNLSSDITDLCLSTSEIILLKEESGANTSQESEGLFYENYVNSTMGYKSFKERNGRDAIEKIKKISRFFPKIYNAFQPKK